MPRIRSVKPEFWTDERAGVLSDESKILFLNRLNFADDEGRFRAHPALVGSECWPYLPEAAAKARRALGALAESGMVRLYVYEGQAYGDIPKFLLHQKISHPFPSRLPPFTERSVNDPDHSVNAPECSVKGPDPSVNDPECSGTFLSGNRMEIEIDPDLSDSEADPLDSTHKIPTPPDPESPSSDGDMAPADVCSLWNRVASEFVLPAVRGPWTLRPKIQTLLKEPFDGNTLLEAFRLFAAEPLVRERRYSLANFLPNRAKYLPRAAEGVRAEEIREKGHPVRA